MNIMNYITPIFKNIYYIIFIIFAFLAFWAFSYYTAVPKYSVESLIKVKEEPKVPGTEEMLSLSSSRINLDEEIDVFVSRSSMIQIIKDLGLNYALDSKFYILDKNIELADIQFRNTSLSKKGIVNINAVSKDDGLMIQKLNGDEVSIFIKFGEYFNSDDLSFKLVSYEENSKSKENINLTVTRPDLHLSFMRLLDLEKETKLSRTSWGLNESLLRISFIHYDTDLASEIIKLASSIYENENIKDKKLEAEKSLAFIFNQLQEIKSELLNSENELNLFKQRNSYVDIEFDDEIIVEKVKTSEEELRKLELSLVEKGSQFTPENALNSTLSAQINVVEGEIKEYKNQISLLPELQQELINLQRNVKINSDIYQELLKRQMELEIVRASTLSNIRVIDEPYTRVKVSPQFLSSLVFYLFFGTFLALAFAYIKTLVFGKLQTPSEVINDNENLSVLGVFPSVPNGLDKFEQFNLTEDLEKINSLITNLNYVLGDTKDNKSIMITGPTPGVGKSFVAKLLGIFLARRDKKVLVMDCDFKRGKLHEFFNSSKLDFSKYFNHSENCKKVNDNLYFYPRPARKGRESLNILESEKFSNLVKDLKGKFDYIIFDTPPALAVSDSLAMTRYVDLNILTIRQGFSANRDVERTLEDFENLEKPVGYFIFNDFNKPSGYYGYDYYSSRYYGSYSYSYDSKND